MQNWKVVVEVVGGKPFTHARQSTSADSSPRFDWSKPMSPHVSCHCARVYFKCAMHCKNHRILCNCCNVATWGKIQGKTFKKM